MGGESPSGSGGAYIPKAQSQADQAYQTGVSTLAMPALSGVQNITNTAGGMTPAGFIYPQIQQTAETVFNNPYQNQYVNAYNDALNAYQSAGVPYAFQGAPALGAFGSAAAGQLPAIQSAVNNPAYAGAQQAGTALSGGLQGGIQQLLGNIFSPGYQGAINYGQQQAPYLTGLARQVVNTGFDPQQALYDRTQQQVMDQVQAANAAAGIGSSPYGAGVAGKTLSDFNIDWQNAQLGRQTAAAQTGAGLLSQGLSQLLTPNTAATSAAATDLSGAGNAVQEALQSILSPANAGLLSQQVGAGALSGLESATQGGYGGAYNMISNLAQQFPQIVGAPYGALNTVQGNNFGAGQNLISLGNQGYALPQQVLNDLQSYLNLGQSASGLANSIGTTNFNQLGQGVGGAANLLSGPLGFGGSSGGLLGNALGLGSGAGGSSALLDTASTGAFLPEEIFGTGAADVGAAGGGSFLDFLAPAALS
jgi:hypothetical protein